MRDVLSLVGHTVDRGEKYVLPDIAMLDSQALNKEMHYIHRTMVNTRWGNQTKMTTNNIGLTTD